MDTNLTAGDPWQRRPHVATGVVDELPHGVYVIATTLPATTHALRVAEALARERGIGVAVLASPPEHVTVSSARAHAFNLPVDYGDEAQRVTPDAASDLIAREHSAASIRTTMTRDAHHLARVLPRTATLVLAGAIHQFIESPEQRLARKLTGFGFDVVFLPCPEE
jgi:hypothetical protein